MSSIQSLQHGLGQGDKYRKQYWLKETWKTQTVTTRKKAFVDSVSPKGIYIKIGYFPYMSSVCQEKFKTT